METMTTKELAAELGVTVRTVQKTAKALFDPANVHSRVINGGKSFVFDEAQATAIKQEIQGHHNLATRQVDNVSTRLEAAQAIDRIAQSGDTDVLAAGFFTFGKALMTSLQAQNKRLETDNEALRIELDKSKDWYSVKRMEALTGAKFSWRTLKRISTAQNIPIKKTFDQNYGEVNVYSVDVWLAAYGDIVGNVIGGAA